MLPAHDLTDYTDELQEVSEPVFERNNVIQVLLKPQEAQAVEQIAKSEGIDLADLIHQWVIERIHTVG